MLRELSIKNYKSILDDKIELGRLNVFIGENGCGKTNILEALVMAGTNAEFTKIDFESLYNKGVRIAKPSLTFSSFLNTRQILQIDLTAKFNIDNDSGTYSSVLVSENGDDIYTNWVHPYDPDSGQEASIEVNSTAISEQVFISFKTVLSEYLIYTLNTQALRGINPQSRKLPLGINGEGLDMLLYSFSKEELNQLKDHNHLISWLDEVILDEKDALKYKGHKLGRSSSILYFRDKFMRKNNNLFAAENANEGALHILFYLALFISQKTPSLFAIDNIENGLNPRICRTLIKDLAKLAADNNKQALITTHNPAVLDGLNLHDDEQRLFVVYRNDAGHTKTQRVRLKPDANGKDLKLSELWMRGYLGGLPNNF